MRQKGNGVSIKKINEGKVEESQPEEGNARLVVVARHEMKKKSKRH